MVLKNVLHDPLIHPRQFPEQIKEWLQSSKQTSYLQTTSLDYLYPEIDGTDPAAVAIVIMGNI